MKRIICLNSGSKQSLEKLTNRFRGKIITSKPQAARRLQVPHYDLESLARSLLFRDRLTVASPLIAYRTRRDAVREVIETSDIEGTARAQTPALQAIIRAGINPDILRETSSSHRVQQLASLVEAYQTLLRKNRRIDSAEIFWEATHLQPERQPILVYGYFQPRLDELAFLDAIAGEGSTFILSGGNTEIFTNNREALQWLQQQGWCISNGEEETPDSLGKQLQQCFLSEAAVPTGVNFHAYSHLEAEVRGVLAQVKALLSQGVAANNIVLVARDETLYGSTILDVAWEYELPVRALYDIPLQETRVGVWLRLLLETIQENFPFELTAELLAHPLAEQLPAQLWSEVRKRPPQGLQHWQELGIDFSTLNWGQQDYRAEWVQRLQEVLSDFQIRQNSGFWAREIVAFYKLQEALVTLSAPETERISLEAFAQDVLDTLALLSVPAQPGRGGVELHAPLSLLGTRYQYVFVLGSAEGILPAPIENDPVLDFQERKQLMRAGLPLESAAQTAQREAFSFYALLEVATTAVTFSYPQLLGKEELLPSPYLEQLGIKPCSPSSLPIASPEEARRVDLRQEHSASDAVLANAIHAWRVEQRRESSQEPDEYDGVVGLPIEPSSRVFSASQLTALGQCPFKWFAEGVLNLKELPEAESDLSPSLKGQLYHRTLELALANVKDAEDLRSLDTEQLPTAFAQAEQELACPTLPGWDVRRAEHIEVLSRNFAEEKFLPPGTEIVALETQFKAQWYGLRVRGRVDRIDQRSQQAPSSDGGVICDCTDSGLVLLDYKTSSTKPAGIKNEAAKANIDIQLPLYMEAVQTALYPDEPVTDAYYYSVTKHKKLAGAKRDKSALAAFAEQVKSSLQTGYYPVKPDVDQHVCRFCPFDLVCRQGPRLNKKYPSESTHESD